MRGIGLAVMVSVCWISGVYQLNGSIKCGVFNSVYCYFGRKTGGCKALGVLFIIPSL